MSDTPARKARRKAIRQAFVTEDDGECVVWTEAAGAVSVGVPSEPSDAPALAGVHPGPAVIIVVERRGYVRRYRMRPNGPVAIERDRDMTRRMMLTWRTKRGKPGTAEDTP